MPASLASAIAADMPRLRPTGGPAQRRPALARPVSAASALTGAIVASEDAFAALQPAWDALAAQVPDAALEKGFAWCHAGWVTTGKPRGRQLAVLTIRDAGKLVLVWPMARRWRGFCAELIPLGSEATDYLPLLIASCARSEAYVRAAIALLRHDAKAGLVSLPLVRANTVPAAVLGSMAPGESRVVVGETVPAP